MMHDLEARDFQARLGHLDGLLREVDETADPAVQSRTREVVQALLELHGTGLDRLLGLLAEAGEAGAGMIEACARDEVVGGLLLLHGLHPLDLESRVRLALDDVRPALRSHGGNVVLVDLNDGIVRLRLEGNCHGCPSSAATMKQTIEEAILARAPDLNGIEVEGQGPTPSGTPDRNALVVLG